LLRHLSRELASRACAPSTFEKTYSHFSGRRVCLINCTQLSSQRLDLFPSSSIRYSRHAFQRVCVVLGHFVIHLLFADRSTDAEAASFRRSKAGRVTVARGATDHPATRVRPSLGSIIVTSSSYLPACPSFFCLNSRWLTSRRDSQSHIPLHQREGL
jgi:hypothetical protein